LEQLGYAVELKSKPGVAPGAQLTGIKGSETRTFAVRSCLNRKVKGVRHEGGTWKTLPDVDEVVVVAPRRGDPLAIEIFGFDPEVVVKALDRALADQRRRGLNPKSDEPVFVSLDERQPRGSETATPGLKSKARWSKVLPISLADAPGPQSKHEIGLLEHLRREAAAWTNMDVRDVAIDIHLARTEPARTTLPAERGRQSGDKENAGGTGRMTEAEHEILESYLIAVLHKCKQGKLDEKTAMLDIAEGFARLQNEGLGSALSYFRATLDSEHDE
jgi:hypothetical protein